MFQGVHAISFNAVASHASVGGRRLTARVLKTPAAVATMCSSVNVSLPSQRAAMRGGPALLSVAPGRLAKTISPKGSNVVPYRLLRYFS